MLHKDDVVRMRVRRTGNVVMMQILEQNIDHEEFRKLFNTTCTTAGGLRIVCGSYPFMGGGTVWLRGGDKKRDDDMVVCSFSAVSEAVEGVERLRAGIKEFGERVWRARHPQKDKNDEVGGMLEDMVLKPRWGRIPT